MIKENKRENVFKELKENVLDAFINSTYEESDRFHVSMHEEVDLWAGNLSQQDALEYLSQFDPQDFKTLDGGLYEGVMEKDGFEKLCVVLAYCLAEQELYNDDFLNSLQKWENEDDKESKGLVESAKRVLAGLKT